MYQMYLLILLPLIILFMITTRVWVKASMCQNLEMIMENEQYNGCLLWNKIILLNVNFDCSLAS